MSRRYESELTVTIAGDEIDVPVRGYVLVEPGLGMGGGWGAQIDGGVEVRLGDCWVPLDRVTLDDGSLDEGRIEDALCEAALEDDGGVDPDEYRSNE